MSFNHAIQQVECSDKTHTLETEEIEHISWCCAVIFQMLLKHNESSLSVTTKRHAEQKANKKKNDLFLDTVQLILILVESQSYLY